MVNKTLKTSRTFEVRVLRQSGLTPLLLAAGISSALEAAYNPGYEATLRTHFEVTGDGGATIGRDNEFYVQGAPDRAALAEVSDLMSLFEDNRFSPQSIRSLTYRAEIDH